MNLLERDLPWLTAEARTDPDTAQHIVRELVGRVRQLQRQADELRVENVLLKRSGSHQAYHDQVQRLKTDLRDLRIFAERNNLNRGVVSIVSFTAYGLHIPAPAPIDQMLMLETALDESVRDLQPLHLTSATYLDSLLAITSTFRLALANGLSLPVSDEMRWRDAQSIGPLALQRGERIEATCAVNESQPPRMVVIVTHRGWVRALSWSLVEKLAISGQPITPPDDTDSPDWIGGCDEGDLLLLTRHGKWTRFPIGSIDAGGSTGIALDADDDVACAAVVGDGDPAVYFVGADGAQLAVANSGLEANRKPGAKPAPLTRRWISLACFTARKTDAVLMLAANGDLIIESLRALPMASRPSEVQPLNAVNQRLIAATLLK